MKGPSWKEGTQRGLKEGNGGTYVQNALYTCLKYQRINFQNSKSKCFDKQLLYIGSFGLFSSLKVVFYQEVKCIGIISPLTTTA